MKTIKLTQDKVTVVDDHNFEWLNQWKWYTKKGKNTWYANRSDNQRKTIRMHRVIMEDIFPEFKGDIDHIDHNGLNNLESNLRIATNAQNMANQQLSRANTSGYKGVRWYEKIRKWRARIKIQQKYIHLSYFVSKEAAALSYDYAAVTYFGEFACLNFPENWTVEKIRRVHIPGAYLL
jgi:hypothetical protein